MKITCCFPLAKKPEKEQNQTRDAQPPQTLQQERPFNKNEIASSSSLKNRKEMKGPVTITEPELARSFRFDELVAATMNFSPKLCLGVGSSGKVFKGTHYSTGEEPHDIAIKQLKNGGMQGLTDFVREVVKLSAADHPNVVKLVGFCIQGEERLLVNEYVPHGSLDHYLHGLRAIKDPLAWNTRMKIAVGAARGLEYLHDKMNPAVIYRNLKCADILLGDGYQPMLSDFGLSKVGCRALESSPTRRPMDKADVYSFGVILLQIITGKKAFDRREASGQRSLLSRVYPLLRDSIKFATVVDPTLANHYPTKNELDNYLKLMLACVDDIPTQRPSMSEVVSALESFIPALTRIKTQPKIYYYG